MSTRSECDSRCTVVLAPSACCREEVGVTRLPREQRHSTCFENYGELNLTIHASYSRRHQTVLPVAMLYSALVTTVSISEADEITIPRRILNKRASLKSQNLQSSAPTHLPTQLLFNRRSIRILYIMHFSKSLITCLAAVAISGRT